MALMARLVCSGVGWICTASKTALPTASFAGEFFSKFRPYFVVNRLVVGVTEGDEYLRCSLRIEFEFEYTNTTPHYPRCWRLARATARVAAQWSVHL
jgi:hypothetical protein